MKYKMTIKKKKKEFDTISECVEEMRLYGYHAIDVFFKENDIPYKRMISIQDKIIKLGEKEKIL